MLTVFKIQTILVTTQTLLSASQCTTVNQGFTATWSSFHCPLLSVFPEATDSRGKAKFDTQVCPFRHHTRPLPYPSLGIMSKVSQYFCITITKAFPIGPKLMVISVGSICRKTFKNAGTWSFVTTSPLPHTPKSKEVLLQRSPLPHLSFAFPNLSAGHRSTAQNKSSSVRIWTTEGDQN